MDSIFDSLESYELKEGLGDCLIAGAALQFKAIKDNKQIGFNTSDKLHFLLDTHPNIKLTTTGKKLLWPSQIKDINLFPLHTNQRFSIQLGFYLDPTYTLDLYINKQKLTHKQTTNTICINTYSAESNRRYIDPHLMTNIISICKAKNIDPIFIGKNDNENSITDIKEIVNSLLSCKLFIGPVSFCYHLAACLGTPSVLLGNYMPLYKFSTIKNTTCFDSDLPCVAMCEEDETNSRNKMQCWDKCKAVPDNYKVINYLNNTL